jgi:hypothetical protein
MEEINLNGKEYVILELAARRSNYDREHLRKLAKAGKVDAVQLGETWLINLESVDIYQRAKPQRKPHKDKLVPSNVVGNVDE